jgi:hypothetical protein
MKYNGFCCTHVPNAVECREKTQIFNSLVCTLRCFRSPFRNFQFLRPARNRRQDRTLPRPAILAVCMRIRNRIWALRAVFVRAPVSWASPRAALASRPSGLRHLTRMRYRLRHGSLLPKHRRYPVTAGHFAFSKWQGLLSVQRRVIKRAARVDWDRESALWLGAFELA